MAIITISRGSFAGGKGVAERVAARLGWPLLSREEVVRQAAGDYGISVDELAGALNQSPPFWQQMLGKRVAYVKCVTAVLLDHAREGKLVYHGYAGHLLLSGLPHVLRVRVIAEMDYRVRRAMEEAKLTREHAIAQIHRVDKERSRWARLLYGVELDDPNQYDAVLNVGRMTVEGACEVIVGMSKLKEFEPTAEGQKKLEDLSLSSRVWAAMARNVETRSAGLQVTADGGEVLITGNVGSNKAAEAIGRLASQVEGVKRLRCEAGMGTDWYW